MTSVASQKGTRDGRPPGTNTEPFALCRNGLKRRCCTHQAMKDFSLRAMTRPEFDLVLDWAAAEGWNPGLFDAVPYCGIDPDGLLLGLLDNEPVAALSALRYDAAFGFIGFYIVRPDCRGQGYGRRLWQAGMARLGSRTIGLDGVLAQQDNYRRSGFELAHRNIRYQGRSGVPAMAASVAGGARRVALQELPLQTLADYEQSFFPARRRDFMQHWIDQPETVALGLMGPDSLLAYGVRRSCRNGYKIGPLFADSPQLAATLLDALCAGTEAEAALFLDVPECHRDAVALADARGMQRVFETARMYTGAAPDLALARSYGITSFEVG